MIQAMEELFKREDLWQCADAVNLAAKTLRKCGDRLKKSSNDMASAKAKELFLAATICDLWERDLRQLFRESGGDK